MPLLGTTGSASAKGFGFLLTAMAKGWALTVKSATKSSNTQVPLMLSNGNVMVPGNVGSESNSYTDGLMLIVTPEGVVNTARYFYGRQYTTLRNIVVDGSGNYFFGGYNQQIGASQGETLFVKINSSYALQLNRVFNYQYYENDEGTGCVGLDSSGNVYLACDVYTGGSNRSPTLIKTDSSGVIVWSQIISNIGYGRYAAFDGSGNTFFGVLGQVNPSNGIYSADVYKYSSTGSLSWQTRLMKNRFPYGNTQVEKVALGALGNIYGCGKSESNVTGNNTGFLFKLNSSGTMQWMRELSQSGVQIEYYAIAVDASENVYAAGRDNDYVVVVKYNSSGSLQWMRRVRRTTAISIGASGLCVDSLGKFIYLTGYTSVSGVNSAMVLKLSADGTGTGTFGTFVYEAISYSEIASDATASNPGNATSATAFTQANAGLSTADRTGLTSALQPF